MGRIEPLYAGYTASAVLTPDPQRIADRVKGALYSTLSLFRSETLHGPGRRQPPRILTLLGEKWAHRSLEVDEESVTQVAQNDGLIRIDFSVAVHQYACFLGTQPWTALFDPRVGQVSFFPGELMRPMHNGGATV